jgi:hypothetical protein
MRRDDARGMFQSDFPGNARRFQLFQPGRTAQAIDKAGGSWTLERRTKARANRAASPEGLEGR